MSRIRVSIGRVVLQGLEQGREKPLIESLRAQLSEMLQEPRTRADWARVHRISVLRLGRMPIETGSSGARRFGANVARGIGRGLKI
jgi:hypothetical protein